MAYILTLICTWYLTGKIRLFALKRNIIDMPCNRSSHTIPTPRGGGASFVIIWTFVSLIFGEWDLWHVFLSAFIVGVIGFVDDNSDLKPIIRFTIQITIASIFMVLIGGWPELNIFGVYLKWGSFGFVIGVLSIVWSVNLFNFMDGIDSFASMEAICIFTAGGVLFWNVGAAGLAFESMLLVFTVFGFLIWNMPPAKIFMGDVGSSFLGFLVAAFAIVGECSYNVPALLWIILYALFWFDSTVTLVRRIIRKHKWYMPHKLHAYQRLHQFGWSHGKITLAAFLVNTILITLTFLGYTYSDYFLHCLVISIVLLSSIYYKIEKINPL